MALAFPERGRRGVMTWQTYFVYAKKTRKKTVTYQLYYLNGIPGMLWFPDKVMHIHTREAMPAQLAVAASYEGALLVVSVNDKHS